MDSNSGPLRGERSGNVNELRAVFQTWCKELTVPCDVGHGGRISVVGWINGGTHILEGSDFCDHCGVSIIPAVAKVIAWTVVRRLKPVYEGR